MDDLHKLKWLPCAAGALLCLVGLACLVWPEALSQVLAALVGACLTALGAGLLACGLAARRRGGGGILLVQSAAHLAAGLVFLLNQDVSLAFLGGILGVWLLVIGVLRARSALAARRMGAPWKGDAVSAALRFGCGALTLVRPFRGLAAGVMLLGAVLVVAGVSLIAGALAVDRVLGRSDELDRWLDDSFGPEP